ncbi:MAG: sugar phosphate isomerase/epimerase [Oscillospiraceae bacterium]|nr:sugar phosphate isomerase/epimerase [Oscillospiraceae bacterium]
MKIAVVVASEGALPSAFTVFRGVGQGIGTAAELGYDGVELAVRDGSEFAPEYIDGLLRKHGMALSAVSTGQLFADRKLWLSARDEAVRKKAVREFLSIVNLASAFGCLVNIGRARGYVEDGDSYDDAAGRFTESMGAVASHAERRGVGLVLEPVNRYETNFINSVADGAALIDMLRHAGIGNVRLMPDFFHMNIEDASIEGSLREHRDLVGYVHAADSNRRAPGWGHLDFASLAGALQEIGYDGWVSVEALPLPDAKSAAGQAIAYLRRYIKAIH